VITTRRGAVEDDYYSLPSQVSSLRKFVTAFAGDIAMDAAQFHYYPPCFKVDHRPPPEGTHSTNTSSLSGARSTQTPQQLIGR
jgi:hypothetical protein